MSDATPAEQTGRMMATLLEILVRKEVITADEADKLRSESEVDARRMLRVIQNEPIDS